jgi:hypothetical protein
MRRFALALLFLAAACGSRNSTDDQTLGVRTARLRNEPPASCTAEKQAQCAPVPKEVRCPDGREPVIDYTADCCAHLTCQPICQPDGPCPVGPAPICPAGSTLTILTASDCCPAYRCDNNGGQQCGPNGGACPEGQHCEMSCTAECNVGSNQEDCLPPQCSGTCVDDTPTCQSNSDCPPGEQCIMTACACSSDDEYCPPCVDQGRCVPIQPTCRSNADCSAGEECLLACSGGNGCGLNDPTYPSNPDDCVSSEPGECVGVCVPVYPGCQTDADCPFGQCVLSCSEPCGDPTSSQSCESPGWCFGQCMDLPPPVCESNADCPTGMICPIPPDCSTGPECDSEGNCDVSECIAQCIPDTVCAGHADQPCPIPEPMPCPYPGAVLVPGPDCCPIYECAPPTDPDHPQPVR